MKFIFRYIIYLWVFHSIISCKKGVSQEELIQSALELKLAEWRYDQIRTCTENAMSRAEAYVDSVLIIYSLPSKLDTIPKPPKPHKPMKPSFRIKPDSVVVEENKGEG